MCGYSLNVKTNSHQMPHVSSKLQQCQVLCSLLTQRKIPFGQDTSASVLAHLKCYPFVLSSIVQCTVTLTQTCTSSQCALSSSALHLYSCCLCFWKGVLHCPWSKLKWTGGAQDLTFCSGAGVNWSWNSSAESGLNHDPRRTIECVTTAPMMVWKCIYSHFSQ